MDAWIHGSAVGTAVVAAASAAPGCTHYVILVGALRGPFKAYLKGG